MKISKWSKILFIITFFLKINSVIFSDVFTEGLLDYDPLKMDTDLYIYVTNKDLDSNRIIINFKSNPNYFYNKINRLFVNNFITNEIFYQTYQDIPEHHGYISGKSFIVLKNGTRIQTQDVKINSDSTFEVFSIVHTLDTNSQILQLIEFPIEKIEFEVYYFNSIQGKKILLSKSNEIGLFKPYSPFKFKNEIEDFIKDNYNLEYKGNRLDEPLSEIIGEGDCEFEEIGNGWSKTIGVDIIADPKVGDERFYFKSVIYEDSTFDISLAEVSYEKLVSFKIISEKDDILYIPKLTFSKNKFTPTTYLHSDKKLLQPFELLDIKSIEYTLYDSDYSGSFIENRKTQSILTKESKKELEKLKVFFSCLIMKINKVEKLTQTKK